jgi:hypothetical protein
MASAGKMMCGKPFSLGLPRTLNSVLQNKDKAMQPDEKQLELLPSKLIHTKYIPLTLDPRRGSRGVSDILPRRPSFTKMNTADVTGKPIAI